MSFREQLMSALEAAVGHFNGGMSDSDSVIKAASDLDFNKDQAHRLVETFNTAKSIYFFKSADDRRNNFTIVDPSVVIESLFAPAAVTKRASAGEFELRDYSFYNKPEPHYDGSLDLDKTGMQKFDWEEVKESAADRTLDSLHFSLRKHASTARQLAERCKSTASMLEAKYTEALEKVAAHIKKDWAEPQRMADVEHYFWAKFGSEMTEPIITDLMQWLPADYQEKRASRALERQPSSFGEDNPKVATFAEEAVAARFSKSAMEGLYEKFEKEASDMLSEWEKIAGLTPPEDPTDGFFAANFLKGAAAGQPTAPVKPTSPKPVAKPGSGFLGPALDTTFKNLSGAATDVAKKPITDAATLMMSGDQAEEQKLTDKMRNLQRQLIIEDLMTTDQVLAGEDPQMVAQAYQTLVDLAPDVSLKKEIVRSVVRASVNAVSMSPFDAKSVVDLENELKKQLVIGKEKTT
jgi:hypothetical protein